MVGVRTSQNFVISVLYVVIFFNIGLNCVFRIGVAMRTNSETPLINNSIHKRRYVGHLEHLYAHYLCHYAINVTQMKTGQKQISPCCKLIPTPLGSHHKIY